MDVKPLTMWIDDDGDFGVVELKNNAFGTSFHPIKRDPENQEAFSIINNLWYTTYQGARQFFRSKTNTYRISGRLKKVEE